MLIVSIFLGEPGIERFLIGDTVLGLFKLFTLGGCMIWWFIDLFLIMGALHAGKTMNLHIKSIAN